MSVSLRYSHERAWSRRLVLILAFAALAGFYIVTAPANRTEADDAFWYAWDVETAPWSGLLHPHHMLYLPLGRILWLVARFAGVAERAYPVLAVTGALTAAAVVLVNWDMLVRRLGMDRIRSAWAVGVLALSYGFWRYSAEVEVYTLALLWCAAIVHLALARSPGRGRTLALVLLGATAPLVHILTAPLVGAAVPVAIAIRRGIGAAVGFGIATACVGLLLISGGYLLAGRPGVSLAEFYTGGKEPAEVASGFESVPNHAVAAGHAVVSGNFIWTYEGFRKRIVSRFPDRMLADEVFAGEHASDVIRIIAPFTLAAVLIASIGLVITGFGRHFDRARVSALALSAVWLVFYLGVALPFSRPGNLEFWILPLLPAWLLLVSSSISEASNDRFLLAVVLALFAHNLVGGLWVYDNASGDRSLQKGGWMIQNSTRDDAILTADGASFFRYLRYRAPAVVFDLQFKESTELDSVFAEALRMPGSVFATADVFRPPAYYGVLRPAEAEALRQFGANVQQDFHRAVADDFGGVWKTTPGVKPTPVMENRP